MITSVALATVIGIAGIVSALNPSTTGILILLATVVFGHGHRASRVFWLGVSYIVALLAVTLTLGTLALYAIHQLPIIAAEYLVIGGGILVVGAGLANIKEYLWYGGGFSLRLGPRAAQYVASLAKGRIGVLHAAWLGVCTAIFSIPIAGAGYVAAVCLLSGNFSDASLSLLGVFNLLFILPLVLIIGFASGGMRLSTIQRWKEESKGRLRLGVGLLLVMLGWVVILVANGVLSLE